MADRLLVAVLGNRNSGKSTTWYHLFNTTVKTGKHERALYLNRAQYVDVFLINGSVQERELDIEDVMPDEHPRIVLCSMQYRTDVVGTFDFFFKHGYDVLVQWLNPGHSDPGQYADSLNLVNYLLHKGATVHIRNGKLAPATRVRELRQYLLGWATQRNLLQTVWPE